MTSLKTELPRIRPAWGRTGARDISADFLISQLGLHQTLTLILSPILESDASRISYPNASDLKRSSYEVIVQLERKGNSVEKSLRLWWKQSVSTDGVSEHILTDRHQLTSCLGLFCFWLFELIRVVIEEANIERKFIVLVLKHIWKLLWKAKRGHFML